MQLQFCVIARISTREGKLTWEGGVGRAECFLESQAFLGMLAGSAPGGDHEIEDTPVDFIQLFCWALYLQGTCRILLCPLFLTPCLVQGRGSVCTDY